jgi:hypothetical protein
MENLFTGENILDFVKLYPDDDSCLKALANVKWANGFICRHCGHEKYCEIKGTHSRECTSCHRHESPTAGTLFHKVKFGIQKAFCIIFEMTCTTKGLSSVQVSKRYGITQKTAWFFMSKVKVAMKSSEKYPLKGKVLVDEFVIGGKETGKQGRSYDAKKAKVVCAVELTQKGKIKRGYAQVIEDYSAKSIETIFTKHIDKEADVKTDKWTAYKKLSKKYKIDQEKSQPGYNFNQIHTIIQQVKSGIRTIQTHVNKGHLQKYLDEYFFRLNRSIHKKTIFHKLVLRMLAHQPVPWSQIVLSK